MKGNREFSPDWSEKPPDPGTYRSIFKWGGPDTFKHPNRKLYAVLKDRLQLTDDCFKSRRKEGRERVVLNRPIRLGDEHIDGLRRIVGEVNVAVDDYSRAKFSGGKTTEEALMLRRGMPRTVGDVVVHPRDKNDVRNIVDYCGEHGIPVYVYGGGSSVTFGLEAVKGGIVMVMSTHLNRVLNFNEADQTITVEAGIMGPQYEAMLNDAPRVFNAKRRYTCGHFPQSFEYSSVGGWIVTLGSGQQSTYYGDIYDIVVSQEYITPAGVFKTLEYPATATGPKINDIMKGSEGAFGILVAATLKIFRYMPENRRRFAFMFPTWHAAVDAARETSQGEFGMPSVFRISDPEETDVALKLYGIDGSILDSLMKLRGYAPMQRCLLIGTADGERRFAANVKNRVKKVCRAHGAMYLSGYPVKKWEHGRYTDPYMREDLNDFGIIIDTLETGVTWDGFHRLHEGVTRFIKTRPNTICMAHGSHFYPQGTNLYFIFILQEDEIDDYRDFHGKIVDRIVEYGGSLSHHHGVGKLLAPWMEPHLGTVQMNTLRALKRHFDPKNIMNPGGTLGLDLPDTGLRKR
ncbi:MAG: FAD-binding oxidoreductase [Desulfomonilaceae bacterium]|nr:FAD-binding oxidoreductase [Desulfomonilaceae bacterium]